MLEWYKIKRLNTLNILLTFLKIYGIINTIKFGGINMLDLNLCFDIYHANDKVGRVEIVNSRLIKNEVYTNKIIERLFPESTPLPNILSILKGRVICKERCDEDMLRSMGLKEYNVYDISFTITEVKNAIVMFGTKRAYGPVF